MWFPEVIDEIGQWPLERYGIVARHLGQFNGAYLSGKPIPRRSWISRGSLRMWGSMASVGVNLLRLSREHPIVRCTYPADTSERIFRLWSDREIFFDALDSLPITFCHLDAFRRNLFAIQSADGNNKTVAIDWAFSGLGTVGEEIAPLVAATLGFCEVEIAQAQELDNIVFDGYLTGLRDAGWHGDARIVRFGYTVASALRYAFPSGAEISTL